MQLDSCRLDNLPMKMPERWCPSHVMPSLSVFLPHRPSYMDIPAVRELTDRWTHRHTGGTDFIPSTADAGGNSVWTWDFQKMYCFQVFKGDCLVQFVFSNICCHPYLEPPAEYLQWLDFVCAIGFILPDITYAILRWSWFSIFLWARNGKFLIKSG